MSNEGETDDVTCIIFSRCQARSCRCDYHDGCLGSLDRCQEVTALGNAPSSLIDQKHDYCGYIHLLAQRKHLFMQ